MFPHVSGRIWLLMVWLPPYFSGFATGAKEAVAMNGEEGASGFDMVSPYARVYGRAHSA